MPPPGLASPHGVVQRGGGAISACVSDGCERDANASHGMCWRHYNLHLGRDNNGQEHGIPPQVRFWEKVDKSSDCWIWTGASSGPNGYGKFSPKHGQPVYAHRFSYTLAHGAIPDGMHILHSCDNRKCVNPAHLSAGSHSENMRDMRSKERNSVVLTREEASEWQAVKQAGLLNKCQMCHKPAWSHQEQAMGACHEFIDPRQSTFLSATGVGLTRTLL